MGRLVLFVALLVSSISLARSQADGNPHAWDRRRRCDHDSYTPQCGACEGFGGIPYGDKNEEIYLTTCEPANSTSIPVKPKWGPVFTVNYYNEVLIGHKTDPFCFNAFPSNDSRGERWAALLVAHAENVTIQCSLARRALLPRRFRAADLQRQDAPVTPVDLKLGFGRCFLALLSCMDIPRAHSGGPVIPE
jgi:hypothetical protein